MRFRRARLADVGPLLEIEREAFATDLLTGRKLRRLLTRGNCELVVAEEGGRLAGYALLLFRRGIRTARLYGFAVAAGFRGHGLGRRLLREAERRAKRRRATRITLETWPSNSAVRLYERAGYEFVADLGQYYEDGSEAHRYAKSL